MTSANQPHYEDSPPVTVQSAPPMPTAASAQYCSSSHDALRTLGFALLAAGTVSVLAAIACYMYLNRGVYNPADAILLLVEASRRWPAYRCWRPAWSLPSLHGRNAISKNSGGANWRWTTPSRYATVPPRQRGRQ